MLLFVAMQTWAQSYDEETIPLRAKVGRGQSYSKSVPSGNYSGITWLGDDRYAVISDKSSTDGFYVFRIEIDSVKGRIRRVENLGFRSSGLSNRDAEGIAWIPRRQTLMMVGEADSRIVEYHPDGRPSGWSVQLPSASKAQGYESLAYDQHSRRLWAMPEQCFLLPSSPEGREVQPSSIVPSQPLPKEEESSSFSPHPSSFMGALPLFSISLDDIAHISEPRLYVPDAPRKKPARGRPYVHGVSEVLALGDGSLLVLEREVWMARSGMRAVVWCKLYRISPAEQPTDKPMLKQPVASWKTSFPSIPPRIANYEGMTLGPRLTDGSQTIILIADSQNRYKGLLRDWFKVIILRP